MSQEALRQSEELQPNSVCDLDFSVQRGDAEHNVETLPQFQVPILDAGHVKIARRHRG